ncbi:hypothetical protein [Streptomyces triculaminicus]|uniref:hypothetical protein n=1 Tax=Streptomyces triculaminicus TaxID=2816232 RepID=UPI003F4CF945
MTALLMSRHASPSLAVGLCGKAPVVTPMASAALASALYASGIRAGRRTVLGHADPQICEGVDDQDVVAGLPDQLACLAEPAARHRLRPVAARLLGGVGGAERGMGPVQQCADPGESMKVHARSTARPSAGAPQTVAAFPSRCSPGIAGAARRRGELFGAAHLARLRARPAQCLACLVGGVPCQVDLLKVRAASISVWVRGIRRVRPDACWEVTVPSVTRLTLSQGRLLLVSSLHSVTGASDHVAG